MWPLLQVVDVCHRIEDLEDFVVCQCDFHGLLFQPFCLLVEREFALVIVEIWIGTIDQVCSGTAGRSSGSMLSPITLI